MDRCVDEDERPSINDIDNFSMIIFKSPFKDHKNTYATSFTILISNNLLVTIRKKNIEPINKLLHVDEETKKKFFSKGSTYLAHQILEKVMSEYFIILDDVEKDIDLIENEVFHNPDKKTVMEVFSLKKTLIYFHKGLSANREVLLGIDNDYAQNIDINYIKKFRYIYEDTVQLIDVVATYRDILTSSLDIYLSNMSNNLNMIMKKMTAFGSIILIPTLITGLYGMNFQYMPELGWKYGYAFAWGLIITWIVVLVTYFKRKDWL